jgi:hypothetical protein
LNSGSCCSHVGSSPDFGAKAVHADNDIFPDLAESYTERSGTSAKILIDPQECGLDAFRFNDEYGDRLCTP